jgi:hypothetical protein
MYIPIMNYSKNTLKLQVYKHTYWLESSSETFGSPSLVKNPGGPRDL